MTARAVFELRLRHKPRSPLLPLLLFFVMLSVTAGFVAYVLWPTWPTAATAPDSPSIPIVVAGVAFNVPPAAIRAAVQRQPGAHERIDLVFLWPSLTPPPTERIAVAEPPAASDGDASPQTPREGGDRLFVTIAGLGSVLPPAERLRSVYPRFFESAAIPGNDGLAILRFRPGTPYEGEDLVYSADELDRFSARCTREGSRTVPATCIHERLLDAAEMTLRFPRVWLNDWRGVVAGFDRLVAQLHQPADGTERK
jgi:hypothetical protein